MRLRGGQERINITLNGIPLNDMIDHGVFFSNFTDISEFQSVQVQRVLEQVRMVLLLMLDRKL